MTKLNQATKNFIYLMAVILILGFSLIAVAKEPFPTVLKSEKQVLIEEQHDIQKKANFWKEKLAKESSVLEKQQRKVDDIKERLDSLSSMHDKNTGRIERIDLTLELYEGFQ